MNETPDVQWEMPRENRNTQWDDLRIEHELEQESVNETQTLTLSQFLKARLDEQKKRYRTVVDDPRWANVGNEGYVLEESRFGLDDIMSKRAIAELHAPRDARPWRDTPSLQCGHCADQCHSHSGLGCDDPDAPYPCDTLRLLAAPYRNHPDWREEWA